MKLKLKHSMIKLFNKCMR